jgi:uncharacterized C2H2 Zn-finger protein
MPTKRQIIDMFGEDRDGTTVVICPHCEGVSFENLEQWKDHMQAEHGGYTVDEVSKGLDDVSKGLDEQEVKEEKPPKPKKLSAKARELNDKCNRCLALILKHLLTSLTEEEQAELASARTDITQAFVGVEFDFEERLFSLEGKWAMVFVLALLYITPALPNLKTIGEKVRKQGKEKGKEK